MVASSWAYQGKSTGFVHRNLVWFALAVGLVCMLFFAPFSPGEGVVSGASAAPPQQSPNPAVAPSAMEPFRMGEAAPAPADESHGWIACCQSTYDLPPLLARESGDLSPRQRLLQRIYLAEHSEGHLTLPEGMRRKLLDVGKDPTAVATQRIVNVINTYLPHETASHNAVRKQRFGNQVDAGTDADKVAADVDRLHNCRGAVEDLHQPDFCFPKNYVAVDSDSTGGEYLEGEHAIVGANMGAYTASHALVIAKKTSNPMLLTAAEYTDMFALAQRFFSRAHKRFPRRRFPVITYDTMHGGGASQIHPHFHLQVLARWYPGKWEAMQRAAVRYSAEAGGRNYYSDLFAAHASVGLAFAGGVEYRAGGFVSMTAATGLELVLMSGEGGSAAFAQLYHAVLSVCYGSLGWTQISSSCMLPPLPAGGDQQSGPGLSASSTSPTMCRMVTRGGYFSAVSDVSANELLATTIVGSDIFEVARIVRAELQTAYRAASQKFSLA